MRSAQSDAFALYALPANGEFQDGVAPRHHPPNRQGRAPAGRRNYTTNNALSGRGKGSQGLGAIECRFTRFGTTRAVSGKAI